MVFSCILRRKKLETHITIILSSHARMMYKPLDRSRREIRVVVIEPGVFGENIHCALQTVCLDDNPAYEALSYVWGESSIRELITLDELSVGVTVNLKHALQHLRRPDRSRVTWVDAICINQDDNSERTHQVGQMGDIYKLCTGVVVWLGQETPDTSQAFTSIEAMADETRHWDRTLKTPLDPEHLSEQRSSSIKSVINGPWWHRAWTVQESILPSSLTFLHGSHELQAPALFAAAQNFLRHGTSCCYNMGMSVGLNVMRSLQCFTMVYMLNTYRQDTVPERVGYLGLNLLELISLYRERKCKDPRDKIYSLLGLASSGVHARLVDPDYNKSTQEVFEDATVELLQRTGGLQVLSLIFPVASPGDEMKGLPSWAPNWTAEGTHENFRDLHVRLERVVMYAASRELVHSPIKGMYKGNGQLHVQAHIIGTILTLGEARESALGPREIAVLKSWHNLANVDANKNRAYPSSTGSEQQIFFKNFQSVPYEDAYLLTISASVTRAIAPFQHHRLHNADEIRKVYNAWWRWIDVQNGEALKMSDIDPDLGVSLNELGNYVNDVSITTSMRRFFLTNEEAGLIGLAPRNAQVGDTIAVLEGGQVPFIIRGPNGDGDSKTWRMVGDTYVHGIMDGEGMEFPAESIVLV